MVVGDNHERFTDGVSVLVFKLTVGWTWSFGCEGRSRLGIGRINR